MDTIADQEKHQVKHEEEHQVELTGTQINVLKSLVNKILSRKEIFAAIGMNGDSRSFKRHITAHRSGTHRDDRAGQAEQSLVKVQADEQRQGIHHREQAITED